MFHGMGKAGKKRGGISSARRGFTLIELVVSVGIIALVAGIAVPSLISITNSLKNKQADDYAKAIYLAAQNTVSTQLIARPAETRTALKNNSTEIPKEKTGNANLALTWNERLRYAATGANDDFIDTYLLPPGSVDAALRNKKILIEFNSYTGEICAVFFLNKAAGSGDSLSYDDVTRDDAARRKMHLGYYASSSSSSYTPPESYSVDFDDEENDYITYYNNGYSGSGNGEVLIRVPVPEEVEKSNYASCLQVDLTIKGKDSRKSITVTITNDYLRCTRLTSPDLKVAGDPAVGFLFTLDSVENPAMSFSNLVAGTGFLIGEDVSLSFKAVDLTGATDIASCPQTITENPLFASASASSSTITVENARNLQNLNYNVAFRSVKKINITGDIRWYSSVGAPSFVPLLLWNGVEEINGNNHSISDLKITVRNSAGGNSIGLFAYLTATAKDLVVAAPSFEFDSGASVGAIGAIAGTTTSKALIKNCHVTDLTMSTPASGTFACGGLVGAMNGGTVESCDVSGSISNTSDNSVKVEGFVGGAIGRDWEGTVYTDVSTTVSLTGWGGDTGGTPNLEDPSGFGVSVGKFIGRAVEGKFTDCYATGVTGDGTPDYQFLGTILAEESVQYFDKTAKYYQMEYADWTDEVQRADTFTDFGKVQTIVDTARQYAGTVLSDTFVNYRAKLNGCHYTTNAGKKCDQIIDSIDYFSFDPLTSYSGTLQSNHSYYIVSMDNKYMLPHSAFEATNMSGSEVIINGQSLTSYLDGNGKLLSSVLLNSDIIGNKVIWSGASSAGKDNLEEKLPFMSSVGGTNRYLIWYYSGTYGYGYNYVRSSTYNSARDAFREVSAESMASYSTFKFGYECSGSFYTFRSQANGLGSIYLSDDQYLAVYNGQFRIYSGYAEKLSTPEAYQKIGDASTYLLRVYDGDSTPELSCKMSDQKIGCADVDWSK